MLGLREVRCVFMFFDQLAGEGRGFVADDDETAKTVEVIIPTRMYAIDRARSSDSQRNS